MSMAKRWMEDAEVGAKLFENGYSDWHCNKGDAMVWYIADYDEPDEGDEAELLMWLSLENYDEEPAIEDDAEWIRRGC